MLRIIIFTTSFIIMFELITSKISSKSIQNVNITTSLSELAKNYKGLMTTSLITKDSGFHASARKHKKQKYKKILKYAFPLTMVILVAKMIFLPFLLQAVTAMSTSSFLMSKMAVLMAGFLTMKFLSSNVAGKDKTKLEIYQIQPPTLYSPYSGWQNKDILENFNPNYGLKKSVRNMKYIPLQDDKYEADANEVSYNRPFLRKLA